MKFFDWLFRRTIKADCGHKTKIKDWVFAFNEGVITELPVEKGRTAYCHKCLEKMAIRCAWCGKTIFIGDAVTLYLQQEDSQTPDYAVFYSQDPSRLVGCLRWECASSGADRSGFWMPPGKVERVPSPLEMAVAKTDPIVLVNDVTDYEEAVVSRQKMLRRAKENLRKLN